MRAVRAAMCGSAHSSAQQCAAVRQCVRGSAAVCGSAAVAGSVWKCTQLSAAVRGTAWRCQHTAQCSVAVRSTYIYTKSLTIHSVIGAVGMSPIFLAY